MDQTRNAIVHMSAVALLYTNKWHYSTVVEPIIMQSSITIYCTLLNPWWSHQMETFSALLALCAGNSLVTGEFPSQRPVTQILDVFFDLHLNKRLSKQLWCWSFETSSRSLWRHCNARVTRMPAFWEYPSPLHDYPYYQIVSDFFHSKSNLCCIITNPWIWQYPELRPKVASITTFVSNLEAPALNMAIMWVQFNEVQ